MRIAVALLVLKQSRRSKLRVPEIEENQAQVLGNFGGMDNGGMVEHVGCRVSELTLVCSVPQHNTGQTMSPLCGTEENNITC